MSMSSGAESTSSVTAQSRNRWGQIALPKACLVRDSIWALIVLLVMGRPDRVSQRWLVMPTLLALADAINGMRRYTRSQRSMWGVNSGGTAAT